MRVGASSSFVYVTVGLVVVLVGIIVATYTEPGATERNLRWVGLVGATAVTFGYVLKWNSKHFKRPGFWLVFLLFLTLHLAAFILVLRRVEQWPLLLFAVMTPAEWLAMNPVFRVVVKGATEPPSDSVPKPG